MDLNTPPNPLSQIPASAPLTKQNKHYEFFIIAIAAVIIAAGFIWWQIGKYSDENQAGVQVVAQTPNPDNKEMTILNQETQQIDTGNLDTDFQNIDKDLNSL